MEHTPASRFVDVLSRLGYKTQQQIADLLDIARPTAGTIVRYEKPPSFESVAKLKEEHPEINMEWVFTGNGSAFVTGDNVPTSQLPPQVPSKLEPQADPGHTPMRVIAESEELKQVKSERDFLRDQNRQLLDLLRSGAYAPAAGEAVGKFEGSEFAAAESAATRHLEVIGLRRYPAVMTPSKYAWVEEALARPLTTQPVRMWKQA